MRPPALFPLPGLPSRGAVGKAVQVDTSSIYDESGVLLKLQSDKLRLSLAFNFSLRRYMLAFTRDAAVPGSCAASGRYVPHPQLAGMGRGGRSFGSYPPCGRG